MTLFSLEGLHLLLLDVMLLAILLNFLHLSLNLVIFCIISLYPIGNSLQKSDTILEVFNHLLMDIHLLFHFGELFILLFAL